MWLSTPVLSLSHVTHYTSTESMFVCFSYLIGFRAVEWPAIKVTVAFVGRSSANSKSFSVLEQ